ncbi:MAG: NYN domain-containing protein [Acidimicrobiales bacterium]
MGEPPASMLRPALELAWAVARVGAGSRPPVASPGPLRPLLGFARLPERALATVQRCLDHDEEFRKRVAEVADETTLGRLPWLWLTKPSGAEEELDGLLRRIAEEASEAAGEKAERRAERRLVAAEEARQRAEREVAELRRSVRDLVAELSEVRLARRKAEGDNARKAAALAAAQEQSSASEAHAARALAEAAAHAARAEKASGEAAALRDELVALRSERDRLVAVGDAPVANRPVADAPAGARGEDDDRRRGDLGAGIAAAASAAADLGRALALVARAWSDPSDGATEPAVGAAARAAATAEPQRRSRARNERKPVALPAAIFDDSDAAASYLVRVPSMVLLVDGYNVSFSRWSEAPLVDQRHRLISALRELAFRVPASVRVVFDGAAEGPLPGASGTAHAPVRVEFSPPGIEADEVIIDTVLRLPAAQPVTVATDDRRVRDEVSRRGANVISTAQLLFVLGRTGRHPPLR